MKDAGILNRRDARLWAHWWTVRGHSVKLEAIGRRLYKVSLRLNRVR